LSYQEQAHQNDLYQFSATLTYLKISLTGAELQLMLIDTATIDTLFGTVSCLSG